MTFKFCAVKQGGAASERASALNKRNDTSTCWDCDLWLFLHPEVVSVPAPSNECVRLQKEELFCQWLEALQVLKQKVKKQEPTERDPFLSQNERARCRPHLRTPLHPLRSASYKR